MENVFELLLLFGGIISRGVRKEDATIQWWLGFEQACLLFAVLVCLWYIVPFAFLLNNAHTFFAKIYRSEVFNEDIYVLQFLLYLVPNNEKNKILGLYLVSKSLLEIVSFGMVYTSDESCLRSFCGVAASVLTVLVYSYRLIVIRLVTKTRNGQFIPFILCLFMFLSAAYFLAFRLLEEDLIAAIPNVFSSCLGAWQLLLYAKYRKVQRVQPDLEAAQLDKI